MYNFDKFLFFIYIESIVIISNIEFDFSVKYIFLFKLIIREDIIIKENNMYLYFFFIKNDIFNIKGIK